MAADKQFTDFLKTAPAAAEALGGKTAVVTGTVYRAESADKFVLATAEGQNTEVPIEAVQRFKIVDPAGLNPLVQLEVNLAQIGAGAFTLKELIKDPLVDTRKELPKDPIFDTRKEIIKEPIKEPIWDPQGTLWSDPPGGTLRENIDIGDPSQQVVNPAFGMQQQFQQQFQQQAGMMPFIMATPHHASAAALAQQPGFGAQLATTFAADQVVGKALHTEFVFDQITRKELIKEPIWDTHKEPIFDPITRWEGGGTIQEGVGYPGQGYDPPVWNLPGTMY